MADLSNKRFWDKVARFYTPLQEKRNKDLYAGLCQNIKPLFRKEHKVLELACGTGQLTDYLADASGSWIATDFSEKMIREAKKRLNRENLTYEVRDATCLTYPDKAFDIVLIANALHIMPDPDRALQQIFRILKDDGILIAPTFVYEGKINKLRLYLMEKLGFKTFHRWNRAEYLAFVESRGFSIKRCDLIDGNLLPECVLVCERQKRSELN